MVGERQPNMGKLTGRRGPGVRRTLKRPSRACFQKFFCQYVVVTI